MSPAIAPWKGMIVAKKKNSKKAIKELPSKPKWLTMAEPCLNHKAIGRLRRKLGLTMEAAAGAAGMNHRQEWYRLESGRRKSVSLSTLGLICRALDCRLDDIVILPR